MKNTIKKVLSKIRSNFIIDIENTTLTNENFRRVLFTTDRMQLVTMSLKPGEEIGSEIHENTDQFFRVEKGEGKLIVGGIETLIKAGISFIIPAGHQHNIVNSGDSSLKLYTIYTPPQHPENTIQQNKGA